jgi:hypothetical protein
MTYQVAMVGSDGVVLASDKRELMFVAPRTGEGPMPNTVTKIRFDPSRRFAWAYAGSDPARIASVMLSRAFESGISESDLEKTIRQCGDTACQSGHYAHSTVVFVDGQSRKILRAKLALGATDIEEIAKGICFTGQFHNKASFVAMRYYSPQMTVNCLAKLGAYSVLRAGELDSQYVEGVDVAVYSDSAPAFEFLSEERMIEDASEIDEGIRSLIR